MAPVRLGFYEENLRDLLLRCHVGELICDQRGAPYDTNHQHAENCVEWNRTEWAVLDLPPEEGATPLEEQKFWRLQIARKAPPHYAEIQDYAGRWLLGSLADEISRSHTIVYHLLLKLKKEEERSFERVGLFVKTVPLGVAYPPGEESTVKIL
jgi:hypothetical protein